MSNSFSFGINGYTPGNGDTDSDNGPTGEGDHKRTSRAFVGQTNQALCAPEPDDTEEGDTSDDTPSSGNDRIEDIWGS